MNVITPDATSATIATTGNARHLFSDISPRTGATHRKRGPRDQWITETTVPNRKSTRNSTTRRAGDGHETPTTSNRPNHHANQLSTPPWREHVPDRCVLNEYDPSLQIAVAPGGAPEPGGTCRGAGMH